MSPIDYVIFGTYFFAVLAVGVYFYRKNETREDYYVGNRGISSSHVGMSIVATDVGGGFSIGLGGLGFTMGLSGSWLLFTGLLGAWLAAVLVVPRVKVLDARFNLLTYPDFLKHKYGPAVALGAAVISGLGYLGFTGAQILAGAKLAAGSVFADMTFMDPLRFSLYTMAAIVVIYTALGGLKAVIYTDTLQWIVLLSGLLFVGLPFALHDVGGWSALRHSLPPAYFTLTNLSPVALINWIATIVPVWFVGMTLYQRIYACTDVKQARRAFYIAGLLEYPLMAFLGVSLGLIARVVFPEADAETAMPMLLRHALPTGAAGIVLAAYFSAIMSTADSCLIASSGHLVNDIIEPRLFLKTPSSARERAISSSGKDGEAGDIECIVDGAGRSQTGKGPLEARSSFQTEPQLGRDNNTQLSMRLSQIATFVLGLIALALAMSFTTVLDIIMSAYAVMVAGLLVPTLAALFAPRPNAKAALCAMVGGCGLTAVLIALQKTQHNHLPAGLDPSVFGITTSLVLYGLTTLITRKSHA